MRTVKFRGWDEKVRAMIYFDELEFSNTGGFWGGDREVWSMQAYFAKGECKGGGYWHSDFAEDVKLQLMEYTGLTDKNGKEIYEGDIVQDTYEASAKGKVVFINGAFRIEYEGGRGGYDISHRIYYKPEVIGNIHENPELLANG